MRKLEGRMDLMRAAKWYHCPLSHEIDTRTAAHVYFTQVLYGVCMLRKMEGMLYLFNGGVPFRLLSFLFSTSDFFSWQYYQPSTSVFFFLRVKLFLSVKLLIIRNCLLRKNIPSNNLLSSPFFFELRRSYAYEDYNNKFILSTDYIEEYFKRYSMFVSWTTSEGILLSSWILY